MMDKKRVLYYDLLNIVACIAVVALHVNGAVWQFSYDRYWITSLITETALYWAVPIFFMLTGATLMDYRERYQTNVFFQKRFVKTGIPFLFWSAVAIPWGLFVAHTLPADMKFDVAGILDAVFNTKALNIYWFFMPLFAVYLCIPFLSVIPKENRKKPFAYLAGLSFVTISCLPLFCNLLGFHFNKDLQNPMGGGFILFVLLGWLLANCELSAKVRYALYIGGAGGWALRFLMTLRLSYANGAVDNSFGGYTNLPSVLLAVAVFVWFRYHDWSFLTGPRCSRIVRTLSGASFGVYLTHIFVLHFLTDRFQIPIRSIWWRIFGILPVYLIPLVITLVIQKIPIIKKIMP